MVIVNSRKHGQRVKEQVTSGGVSALGSQALFGETHRFRGYLWNLSGGPEMAGSFFEGDAQISAQPVDELQNGARFGLDDAFHHYLADRVPHTYRNAFLVHI
jgi:hypothetical protein